MTGGPRGCELVTGWTPLLPIVTRSGFEGGPVEVLVERWRCGSCPGGGQLTGEVIDVDDHILDVGVADRAAQATGSTEATALRCYPAGVEDVSEPDHGSERGDAGHLGGAAAVGDPVEQHDVAALRHSRPSTVTRWRRSRVLALVSS